MRDAAFHSCVHDELTGLSERRPFGKGGQSCTDDRDTEPIFFFWSKEKKRPFVTLSSTPVISWYAYTDCKMVNEHDITVLAALRSMKFADEPLFYFILK